MNSMNNKVYVIIWALIWGLFATIIMSLIFIILVKVEVYKLSKNVADIEYTLNQWELTK